MIRSLLRGAILFLLPALCLAQTAKGDGTPHGNSSLVPKAFSGTLISVVDDTVTLADKDGKTFVVLMTPGWTVSMNRPAEVSVIKPGDFIATNNVPIDTSTGRATEVRVLEPGYRPEMGTHPVSPTNSNMMTHGTVSAVTKSDSEVELIVDSPGGSRRIIVPAGVQVTVSDLLPRSKLKPGTLVTGVTRTDANGVARSSRIQPAA